MYVPGVVILYVRDPLVPDAGAPTPTPVDINAWGDGVTPLQVVALLVVQEIAKVPAVVIANEVLEQTFEPDELQA